MISQSVSQIVFIGLMWLELLLFYLLYLLIYMNK